MGGEGVIGIVVQVCKLFSIYKISFPPFFPPHDPAPSAVVYSLLYERVFEETLSQSSKQRLKILYDSEVQKLATEDKGDKHLTFLSKTYPIGVLEGMGQNCFSNTPLHVYRRERECKRLWGNETPH